MSSADRLSVLAQLGIVPRTLDRPSGHSDVAEPASVQPGVNAAGRDQFVVTAALDDAPPVEHEDRLGALGGRQPMRDGDRRPADRKSTRLNSSHVRISYAVFCLKKK